MDAGGRATQEAKAEGEGGGEMSGTLTELEMSKSALPHFTKRWLRKLLVIT